MKDVIVIGAGLTGLSTAFKLAHKDILVLESQNRIGGQIETHEEDGFIFESGPNTGSISWPEVKELFEALEGRCELQTADESAKRRLIWKGDRFWDLPSSLKSAIRTPLFSWHDKFRILGEPWRAKGTNPNETVGELTRRRLGQSFLDYAVNPFISGVYAGDPMNLVTRFALPKLYRLESEHGSFVRGSIAKMKEPKTDRDRKATKQVFSARGGLSRLVEALADAIGRDRFALGISDLHIAPQANGTWMATFRNHSGDEVSVEAKRIVTTVGAYSLPKILPFVQSDLMDKISNLHYAPVVQVSVGLRNTQGADFRAFGALVPQCENKKVLGILFPSSCFAGRAPEGGVMMSFFMAGVRHPEMLKMSDDEIRNIVVPALAEMFKLAPGTQPDVFHVFRHERAIPQYDATSGDRFEAIDAIEKEYPGLVLAGNIRNGIGMADRIRQGVGIAEQILQAE